MKYIDLVVNKSQTQRVNCPILRKQLWDACYPHLPVTFANPERVLRASRLFCVTLSNGEKAYRLQYPLFGTRHVTEWYK